MRAFLATEAGEASVPSVREALDLAILPDVWSELRKRASLSETVKMVRGELHLVRGNTDEAFGLASRLILILEGLSQ